MFLLEILIVIAAYLIGSLSSALIVSKKLGMPDPRHYGSGNPGASNVLRSGRKDAAAWTLAGDVLKGLTAVLLARIFYATFDNISASVVALAAIAVVVGHMWPVFFGFRGGKGVATAFGVLLGMSLWSAFFVFVIWAAVAIKSGKSSLATIVSAICAPWITFIILRNDHVTSWGWAILFIVALIIYRHKANICRLRKGCELGVEKIDTAPLQAAETTPAPEKTAEVSPIENTDSAPEKTEPESSGSVSPESDNAESAPSETIVESVAETTSETTESAPSEHAPETQTAPDSANAAPADEENTATVPKKRGRKKSSES